MMVAANDDQHLGSIKMAPLGSKEGGMLQEPTDLGKVIPSPGKSSLSPKLGKSVRVVVAAAETRSLHARNADDDSAGTALGSRILSVCAVCVQHLKESTPTHERSQ